MLNDHQHQHQHHTMTTTTEQIEKEAFEKAWESLIDAGLLPEAFILRKTYEKRLVTNTPKT
jgi:hypothetical protein